MSITLLGPQRVPIVKDILDDQGIDGPVAVITGGWEEREDEQDDLQKHIGRPTVNLQLYRRLEQVLKDDRPLSEALVDRNDRLRVAQTLYRRRLGPSLQAVWALHELRVPRMELLPSERNHALKAVAHLDAHYLEQVRGIHTAFQDLWAPVDRPVVERVREQLVTELEGCTAVLIAGGHVGGLLDQVSLFELRELLEEKPVIAWSAGAMILTERIVLFHDSPTHGQGHPEVYDDGLGLAPNVVALPDASERLRLGDKTRVRLFAGRFHPATCVALDGGCGVHWDGVRWSTIGPVRRLSKNGRLAGMVAP